MVHSVDVDASTGTDDLVVITEYGDEEEEIKESRNPVKIQEIVEFGHHTKSSGSTSPTIPKKIVNSSL